ncbi:ADP-ribosylglycohydrolase family protein [Streptomyces sp. NPDC004838]
MSRRLRTLATRLLDELAALSSPLTAREPTELHSIRTACPGWPTAVRSEAPQRRPAPDHHGGSQIPRPTLTPAANPPGGGPDAGARPEGCSSEPWPAPAGLSRNGPREDRTAGPRSDGHETTGHETTGHETAGHETAGHGTTARRVTGNETTGNETTGHRATGNGTTGHGYRDALHAAWLGRAAGCLLGKPVEKLPLHAIRAIGRATGNWPLHTWFTARGLPADLARAHPWNRRSAPTSLAENIDGMPEDDDLNYPLLNLLLIQRYGRDFRTEDVGRLWLDVLPAGRTFTAERIAYRNLLSGVEPPDTASHHNPFREWIGAAIRADTHGWTHPGDPGAAAAQAYRDASLTHTANGVYSAMFIAASIAAAAGGAHDVHQALAVGLTVVPPGSRLAEAVRSGIDAARAEPDFDTVVDRLHTSYGRYHWVHAVPNAALLAAALTHADGDFTGSICRAVSGGWDTDSNGATAGSIAGLLAGRPERLPDRWTAPLRNRLATSVAGFDGIGFDALAHLTHQEALRP